MSKRVAKVQFIGQAPFIIPIITYENGENEFLTLKAEEREKELQVAIGSASEESSDLRPLPQSSQLEEYLEQTSRSMVGFIQRMFPQPQPREIKKTPWETCNKPSSSCPYCVYREVCDEHFGWSLE